MPRLDRTRCDAWTHGDAALQAYHDHEWCRPEHDDRLLFELLCLEGASVGLSWKQVLHRREAYRAAFSGFDIGTCAALTDERLAEALANPGIIRSRGKVASVRSNARVAQEIREQFGSLNAYLWGFTNGAQVVGKWERLDEVPVQSELSREVAADLKRRGCSYVGPIITYSYLQSVGIINDHLISCPRREECAVRN